MPDITLIANIVVMQTYISKPYTIGHNDSDITL